MQSITAVHPVKLNVEFSDGRKERFRVVLWSSGDTTGHSKPMPWIVYEGDIVSDDELFARDGVKNTFLTTDGE